MLTTIMHAPPDTSRFMIAGYAVIFIAQALYLVSLWWRTRQAKRELAWLDELEREGK